MIHCIDHKGIKLQSMQGDVEFLLLTLHLIFKILENVKDTINNTCTWSTTWSVQAREWENTCY